MTGPSSREWHYPSNEEALRGYFQRFEQYDSSINGKHITPQYVDTKSSVVDLGEKLTFAREAEKQWHKYRIEQRRGTIRIDTEFPILVVGIGDVHLGSVYTHMDRFLEDTASIVKTPNVYIVFLSNLIDNAIPSQYPDSMLVNSLHPEEQVIVMRKIVQELDSRGKVLGTIRSDCHEGWCVPIENTEILTKDGWRKEDEVNIGDEILTFDIFEEKFEYKPVLDKYVGGYEGEMITIENDNVKLVCTPNHKILYKRHEGRGKTKKFFHEAKMLKKLSNIKFWQTSEFKKTKDGTNRRCHDNSLKLIAWIVTEGTINKNRITIYQSTKNKKYVDMIRKIIVNNHLKFSERLYPSGFGGAPVVGFSFNPGTKWLDRWFPDRDVHRIPRRVFLFKKDKRLMFLNELILGDGSSREFTYHSKRWELASDVQELAIKSGIKATITKRKGNEMYDVYMKHPIKVDRYVINLTKGIMKTKQFEGGIWCPHTVNGTVVLRIDGKVCVTGNTWANTGQDINRLIFGYEGRRFPILENGGELDIEFPNVKYTLALYHKVGPFESQLNKCNSLRRMRQLRNRSADILMGAHKHIGESMQTYEGSDEGGLERVCYLRTGTYKLSDMWIRDRGYREEPPAESVHLYPDEKRLQPYLELDTAIEHHIALMLYLMNQKVKK